MGGVGYIGVSFWNGMKTPPVKLIWTNHFWEFEAAVLLPEEAQCAAPTHDRSHPAATTHFDAGLSAEATGGAASSRGEEEEEEEDARAQESDIPKAPRRFGRANGRVHTRRLPALRFGGHVFAILLKRGTFAQCLEIMK